MKKKSITVLSLFDGISIAQQSLKELGIKIKAYYASEIDKYAISIAQKNHPKTIQLGDVKYIGGDTVVDKPKYLFVGLRHKSVEFKSYYTGGIDLLIGGSPCQDLSIAKKGRKGLSGDRSGLFYEYLRILKETQPEYFILENVASMPAEAKAIITMELFNIPPIMINASLVSAQNRKRLFWVGRRVGNTYKQVEMLLPGDKEIYLKDIIHEFRGEDVDRKFFCSAESIKNNYRITKAVRNPNEKSKALTATMWKGSGNDGMTTIRVGSIGKGGQGDRVYSVEGKSVALSANGGGARS